MVMASSSQTIRATIDFLADIPLYDDQKPFHFHAPAFVDFDEDQLQTSNIQWNHQKVTLDSMRDRPDLGLEKNGFTYIKHQSACLPNHTTDIDGVKVYKREVEELLKLLFGAVFVHCYDYKRRHNTAMVHDAYNPRSQLIADEVAVGAHDITVDTVEDLITNILTEEQQSQYCQGGYRLRLVNLWRPLVPIIEDRPLGFCSNPSVDTSDLVPTDRVYPNRLQEIYYLKHNPRQQWYWLPNQRSEEPFIFMTYDSWPGEGVARYCPHVSFDNPLASPGAEKRHSCETRNLVITKLPMASDSDNISNVNANNFAT